MKFLVFLVFFGIVFSCLLYLFFATDHHEYEKGLIVLSQVLPFSYWYRYKYVRGLKWLTASGYLLYVLKLSCYFLASSLICVAYESQYENYFHYCLLFFFIIAESEILSRSSTLSELESRRDEEVEKENVQKKPE